MQAHLCALAWSGAEHGDRQPHVPLTLFELAKTQGALARLRQHLEHGAVRLPYLEVRTRTVALVALLPVNGARQDWAATTADVGRLAHLAPQACCSCQLQVWHHARAVVRPASAAAAPLTLAPSDMRPWLQLTPEELRQEALADKEAAERGTPGPSCVPEFMRTCACCLATGAAQLQLV